jgi:sphinganine-1-phosphate aldolase
MLNVQALVADVPREIIGMGVAAALLYVSLRSFFNVDRFLRRVYPLALAAGLYWRSQTTTTALPKNSFLLEAWHTLAAQAPQLEAAMGDVLVVMVAVALFTSLVDMVRKARYVSRKQVLNFVGGAAVDFLKKMPIVSGKVAGEIKKIEAQIEHVVKGEATHVSHLPKNYVLPKKGMHDDELSALLLQLVGNSDKRWQDGLVSGAVYHGEENHLKLLNKAYELFSVSNPLHGDLWPAVNKFEAEVIQMTANLMSSQDDNEVCGSISSGGTESVFLATKAHRAWFRHKYGIMQPEIIAGTTAHAAIDKACDILGIKLVHVPVDPKTLKMDLDAVRWSITANTIMIYSSAPNFPNGVIDDIASLSKIALQNDVGLHVDCCLGGFVLPFAKKLRPDVIPDFNFDLPGVTSMSCDTHKYAYASKGTSVVLYRNKTIRHFQYFVYPDWSGGLYITPTLAGSRAGALSAAAWTSMIRLGHDGYMKNVDAILKTADEIKAGIKKIDGIKLLGDPVAMVVGFRGDGLNILKVSDNMTKKGWSLNSLQHPASVHICVTLRHIGKAKKFLADLTDSVKVVKADPNGAPEGGNAIYGMASSMPAGPVVDILRIYTDVTLKV